MFICTGVSGAGVKLRVFGPHTNESSVTICPDDDYLLVMECIVTESVSFSWTVTPLIPDPVLFTSFDVVGGANIDRVNFILNREKAEMENVFNYISQVQLRTDLIRQTIVEHGEMEVSCSASTKINASILLDMQGMYVNLLKIEFVNHAASNNQ